MIGIIIATLVRVAPIPVATPCSDVASAVAQRDGHRRRAWLRQAAGPGLLSIRWQCGPLHRWMRPKSCASAVAREVP